MKLYFQHLAGRIAHTDWQYSPVIATFRKGEEQAALESGWLMNEWEPPFWFQGRQVRFDLKALDFISPHKYPLSVDFDIHPIDKDLSYPLHQEIWERYLEYKGFSQEQDFRDSLKLDPDKKILINVYDHDELVAFSIVRLDPGPVSLQFAWNYHNPKLGLGIHTQHFEMDYLHSEGYSKHYICPGYETICLWKTRFPGFEFWTGTSWSTNKMLYKKLCERDSILGDVDELGSLEELHGEGETSLSEWMLCSN